MQERIFLVTKISYGMKNTSEFWMSHNGFFLGPWLSLRLAGFSTSALCSSLAHSEAITPPSLFVEHSEFSDFGNSFSATDFSGSLFVHLEPVQPHDGPQLPPVDRHWHFVVLHKDFLLQEQQSPSRALSLLTLFSVEPLIPGISSLFLSLLSSERRRSRSC